MKRLTISILLLVISNFVYCQWNLQETNTLSTLWSIEDLGGDTLIATGSYGLIIKSIDGGTTWTTKTAPVNYQLYDVDFYDGTWGLAIGEYKTILLTDNGGESWGNVSNHDNTWLSRVKYLNDTMVFIVGYEGKVRKSVDRGITWPDAAADNIATAYDLKDIWYFQNDDILICGENGILVTSSDYGVSWNIDSINTAETLRSIDFIDDQTGFIVGDNGTVYSTTDGGGTWSLVTAISSSEDFYDVKFTSSSVGYIIGTNGLVLKTDDGGVSWELQSVPTTTLLNKIEIINSQQAYICGAQGLVLKTDNGGLGTESINGIDVEVNYDFTQYNLIINGTQGKPFRIKVYNLNGAVVAQKLVDEGAIVKMKSYAPGMYIYDLTDGNASKFGKFIVR